MDAVELLRNRVAAIGAVSRDAMTTSAGLDWTTPLLPGTSPLGLTLWHLPRTVDWLVNTTVRGRAEVADDATFGDLPAPDEFGFGTGLSPDRAADAAAQVRPEALVAYSQAVHAMADEWLATLTAEALDERVPQFLDRQHSRPAYCTDEALAEVTHLVDLPLGILLVRPAMSHLLMHLGEVDLLTQLAR